MSGLRTLGFEGGRCDDDIAFIGAMGVCGVV